MSSEIEDRLQALEERVARLEAHCHKGTPRGEWGSLKADHRLTDEHADGICRVLDETHEALVKGEVPEASIFEQQVLTCLPSDAKPAGQAYEFIKHLMMVLDQTGQWPGVSDHYRRDFNVSPPGFSVREGGQS